VDDLFCLGRGYTVDASLSSADARHILFATASPPTTTQSTNHPAPTPTSPNPHLVPAEPQLPEALQGLLRRPLPRQEPGVAARQHPPHPILADPRRLQRRQPRCEALCGALPQRVVRRRQQHLPRLRRARAEGLHVIDKGPQLAVDGGEQQFRAQACELLQLVGADAEGEEVAGERLEVGGGVAQQERGAGAGDARPEELGLDAQALEPGDDLAGLRGWWGDFGLFRLVLLVSKLADSLN